MLTNHSFGEYWARRLDHYLRRRNFWFKMGILGASYSENRGLCITGDGFVQLSFEMFDDGRVKVLDFTNWTLANQLCISWPPLHIKSLLNKFKLLNKMNSGVF